MAKEFKLPFTAEQISERLATSGDWAQNDPLAPDYIKNRTHYEINESYTFSLEDFDSNKSFSFDGIDHYFRVTDEVLLQEDLIGRYFSLNNDMYKNILIKEEHVIDQEIMFGVVMGDVPVIITILEDIAQEGMILNKGTYFLIRYDDTGKPVLYVTDLVKAH